MVVHVLEDDFGVSDALQLWLEQIGHEVRLYPCAEDFFGAEPPHGDDLVFVDLGLPGASGADVIRWLGGLPHAPRVVAISGKSRADIRRQMSTFGELPVLRKPLSEENLLSCL